MLQFHLSKDASKDLSSHVGAAESINYQGMQWYLHRVTVARRKCLVVMELQSRYAMVFCGLTKPDFERFPEMFMERLLREALLWLGQERELSESQMQDVADVCLSIVEDQTYQVGSDRSVMAHINEVAWLLRKCVEDGYLLPEDDLDAMAFGEKANTMLRKTKEHKDYFYPKEVFTDFWAGLLQFMAADNAQGADELPDDVLPDNALPDNALPDNVVHVDFKARR